MIRELLSRAKNRTPGHRMQCRDDHGRRCLLRIVPRPDGRGVRLRTAVGDLDLSPLEVGQLRRHLAEVVVESETVPAPATGRAA